VTAQVIQGVWRCVAASVEVLDGMCACAYDGCRCLEVSLNPLPTKSPKLIITITSKALKLRCDGRYQ